LKKWRKKFENTGTLSLAGFIFLRFICPAIISPTGSNIVEGTEISVDAQRHLILIAKIIQNIANGVLFGQKEPFMLTFNNFVESNIEKVKIFLHELAQGTSLNSSEIPKISPIELLAEIDNFTEHMHKNIGLIEQKLPQDNQEVTLEWNMVKTEIQKYIAVIALSKQEKVKVRNKFCLFH